MAYDVVAVKRFGGLKYAGEAGDVGLEGARVADNVRLGTDLSYVRTRDGSAVFSTETTSGTTPFLMLVRGGAVSGAELLVVSKNAGSSMFVDSWTDTGVKTAIGNWLPSFSPNRIDAVVHGTAAGSDLFVASGGAALMRKVTDAGVLSASVGRPTLLGVTPESNRLIQGRFGELTDSPSGANGTPSTLFFSDPDAGETYLATNFVHLGLGDGEALTAITAWRGMTIAFKETRMFVMDGEGLDATQEPIFDFVPVNLGARINLGSVRCPVGVGRRGAYFLAFDGVYRTTGGPPVKVSTDLDILFEVGAMNDSTLGVVGERVFVQTASNCYALDERHGQWVKWTVASWAPFIEWPVNTVGEEQLLYIPVRTILQSDSTISTDNGVVFASAYETGFSDLGHHGLKVIDRSRVWGSGTPTYSMSKDYGVADAGTALALAAAPGVSDLYERTSRRGTHFAFRAARTSGPFQLNEVDLLVASRWPAGSR